MNTIWTELSCEVPTEMVDQLADFLVEISGNGVSIENIELDTFSLDSLEETPTKTVKAYFVCDASLEEQIARVAQFLAANGPAYPGFSYRPPTVATIKNEDWANNWKQHFKPVRIGTRLIIKPTWEEYAPAPGDIILQIDPGMAFGTGAHPTTKMCLESLERIYYHETPYAVTAGFMPLTVLDVGTGSGVLSIAAAKMGAEQVVAIDIDPDAVVVTGENLVLNGVEQCVSVSTTPLGNIAGDFSIVVANILAEELVRLATELVDRTLPGGFLILSGILTEKEELVITGFSAFPLTLRETSREAEWSCLTFCREV
jgi:ribosomal protein L11 methyltransferase